MLQKQNMKPDNLLLNGEKRYWVKKQLMKIDDITMHACTSNGLYDGTASENLLREGLGTCGVDNREEYYSDSWEDDKPHGYGYNLKKSWFTY
ncbi:unnamed protein product [Rotaria socialis]|uniref:Uncharacterized protein n=1 Tax=Rotaria socialis TaxID=392032 RepID=A0A820N456_9BILA|nr:unnamed protein product [Rotaria socialis]CAF3713897.1 unnamed protein product [Rotaria socialis]CAF4382529.1 unnamed protein product [Rotaria socialis]CAF4737845.1 unnamed protein product [Rotaria socialis]